MQSLVTFTLVVFALWFSTSAFIARQTLLERQELFESVVESNREIILSGQWRPFIEGLSRAQNNIFQNIQLCWNGSSEAECKKIVSTDFVSLPFSVAVKNGPITLLWVNANISMRSVLYQSVLFFVALLIVTITSGLLIFRNTKMRFKKAEIDLASTVAKVIQFGNEGLFDLLPEDIQPMGRNLFVKIKSLQEFEKKQAIAESAWKIAAQVGHDLRSPLAVLNMLSNLDLKTLSADEHLLFSQAVTRVSDICHALLTDNRTLSFDSDHGQLMETAQNKYNLRHILPLVEEILKEKRFLLPPSVDLSIEDGLMKDEFKALFANINSTEFKRVISNLIDNAVDSLTASNKQIKINLFYAMDAMSLQIKDFGRGIPESLISKLGTRGFSYDKDTGSGLGIYHAKKVIDSWGGKLEIESRLGKGTRIRIVIPLFEEIARSPSSSSLHDTKLASPLYT